MEKEVFEEFYGDIAYYKKCFNELKCDWDCLLTIAPSPVPTPQCDSISFTPYFEKYKGTIIFNIDLDESIDPTCTYTGVIREKGTSILITYFNFVQNEFGFENILFDLSTMKNPFVPNKEYDIYLSKVCEDCVISEPIKETVIITEQKDCKDFDFELYNIQVFNNNVIKKDNNQIPELKDYVSGIQVYIDDDDTNCLYDISTRNITGNGRIKKWKDVSIKDDIKLSAFTDGDTIIS